MFHYKFIIEFLQNSKLIVERRDFKPCVGTVAGQDVGNTGQINTGDKPMQ